MDAARKAELKAAYKERRPRAGVFQVVNRKNGKVLVRASMDIDALMTRTRFGLAMGGDMFHDTLQKEWKEFGAEAFSFEVLELLEKMETKTDIEIKGELEDLEKKYLRELQPYGDRGYNRKPIM